MHRTGIRRADRHDGIASDPVGTVEVESDKMFARVVAQNGADKGSGLFRFRDRDGRCSCSRAATLSRANRSESKEWLPVQ